MAGATTTRGRGRLRSAMVHALVGSAMLACGGTEPPPPTPTATAAPTATPTTEPRSNPSPPSEEAACVASALGDLDASLVRALCREMVRTHTPGAAVAIATRDGLPQTGSAGVRCRGRADPVRPDTPFRIGSITKSLLATAVVRHAQASELSLDAAVTATLPLPPAYGTVTWRHLLDHTAGLPDTEPSRKNAALSGQALVDALLAPAPLHAPGQAHHYANAGYVVAGLALQRRTRRSALEAIRAVVADGSGNLPPAIAAGEHPAGVAACGHLGDTVLGVTDDLDALAAGATWTFPAGGVVLDAPTLARVALANVPALTIDGPPTATGTPPWAYALGMRRRTLLDGDRLWFHAGVTGDFAADLHVLPDQGIAVVVLANAGQHLRGTSFAALARAAPGLSLGPAAPAPASP